MTDLELLKAAARALRSFSLRALTVKPSLDKPYRDDPRWSPWTHWIEPEARRAHDPSRTIRKRLADDGIRVDGPDGAVPGVWPELPEELAAVRPLEEAFFIRQYGDARQAAATRTGRTGNRRPRCSSGRCCPGTAGG